MPGSKLGSSVKSRKHKAKSARLMPVKQSLSTELVGDSDDDSEDEEGSIARQKSNVSKKPMQSSTKTASTNVTSSSAKTSKDQKRPDLKIAKGVPSESESGGESKEDDDSGSETSPSSREESPTPFRPRKPVAQFSKATPSHETPTTGKALKEPIGREPKALKSTKYGRNSSKSVEDSRTISESSESGSESESGSSDQTSLQSPRKRSPTRNPAPERVSELYKPPPGFQPASVSFHPSSRTSEIFAPSNLAGKQIWHITAPSSVPLTSVKEVSSNNIANGGSVLSYKGANYGLAPELDADQASNPALLLPSSGANDYKPCEISIIKTLHLQQIVSLPSHTASPARPPSEAATVSGCYKRTPRPQPQGLKMRYHPFGASDESDSEISPSENVTVAPQFRLPIPAHESPKTKKRKHSESANGALDIHVSSAKPKEKKPKTSREASTMDEDITMDDVAQGEALPERTSRNGPDVTASDKTLTDIKERRDARRKRKTEKQEEPTHDHPPAISALPADVTKEAATIIPEEVVEGNSRIEYMSPPPQESLVEKKRKRKAERHRQRDMEKMTGDLPRSVSMQPSQASKQGETTEERAKRKEEKKKRELAAREA